MVAELMIFPTQPFIARGCDGLALIEAVITLIVVVQCNRRYS